MNKKLINTKLNNSGNIITSADIDVVSDGTAMVAIMAANRGSGLAKHGVAGNIGLATSPALAVFIASTFGWRISYVAVGCIAFIAYLFFQKFDQHLFEVQLY